MIGGLVYSYFAGSYFDSHAKEFRLLLADVINDVALTLDMIAPYFGSEGSIWILGLSTIGKTICGITAGATKGHITQVSYSRELFHRFDSPNIGMSIFNIQFVYLLLVFLLAFCKRWWERCRFDC